MFGPLLFFGLKQMKGYEPGDADWGVKLADVRGQTESKAEVEKVIELWSAGDEFRAAGGKPERGLLFIGPPGTGKTMLSKGIATSFNSPIVTMPGSGFAQTFIGMDVIIVMALIRKARKLARKWGDTCMVFIDEIDAVGMRRQALGNGGRFQPLAGSSEPPLYGPWGARTPSGDLRSRTSAGATTSSPPRQEQRPDAMPAGLANVRDRVNGFMFPGGMGGMGGGLALNQLLVQMDGVDEPPFMRKFLTNRFNTFLDATYFIPRKIGKMRAAREAAEAAPRAGLLHRRHERADRRARPGARAPGPHGPPHLVPHAHEGRPRRHLRALPRPGRPRDRARPARAPRRARAHDERVLPGHDRAGLLDGADVRALRRPPRVRPRATSSRR